MYVFLLMTYHLQLYIPIQLRQSKLSYIVTWSILKSQISSLHFKVLWTSIMQCLGSIRGLRGTCIFIYSFITLRCMWISCNLSSVSTLVLKTCANYLQAKRQGTPWKVIAHHWTNTHTQTVTLTFLRILKDIANSSIPLWGSRSTQRCMQTRNRKFPYP